jgi:hypothetical protein
MLLRFSVAAVETRSYVRSKIMLLGCLISESDRYQRTSCSNTEGARLILDGQSLSCQGCNDDSSFGLGMEFSSYTNSTVLVVLPERFVYARDASRMYSPRGPRNDLPITLRLCRHRSEDNRFSGSSGSWCFDASYHETSGSDGGQGKDVCSSLTPRDDYVAEYAMFVR